MGGSNLGEVSTN